MNGKMPYSKETFVEANNEKDFRGMLYDMLAWDNDCTQIRREECQVRFAKLEKRRWFDKGIAIVAAAVVALATALGIKIQ